jgi:hypothetical protein
MLTVSILHLQPHTPLVWPNIAVTPNVNSNTTRQRCAKHHSIHKQEENVLDTPFLHPARSVAVPADAPRTMIRTMIQTPMDIDTAAAIRKNAAKVKANGTGIQKVQCIKCKK